MSSTLNLATLPPDIIRIIAGMRTESIEALRMISPNWNVTVRDYCKDRIFTLPMERLHIHSGVVNYADIEAEPSNSELADQRRRVHIHAIVPEQSADLVGIGKWLTVHKNYPIQFFLSTDKDKAIEVTCEPLKAEAVLGTGQMICLFIFLGLLVLGTAAGFAARISTIVGLAYTVLLPCALVYILKRNRQNRASNKKIRRLNRLITLFDHIETMVVDMRGDVGGIGAFLAKMTNVRVDHLQIRDAVCDGKIRNLIIDLALKHDIRHVSMVIDNCEPDALDDFLRKLCNLGITVSIYEIGYFLRVREYFRRPPEFWHGVARDLQSHNIQFSLTHDNEPGFKTFMMNARVKSTIRCKPDDPSVNFPTTKSRGFYKS